VWDQRPRDKYNLNNKTNTRKTAHDIKALRRIRHANVSNEAGRDAPSPPCIVAADHTLTHRGVQKLNFYCARKGEKKNERAKKKEEEGEA
jgi:hypothetical protein